ncbi:MAG: TonB-dependent receptor [Tannerellaceae bacterium]|nr:TonB-dependent receptor [Tannerellaceae bacterium]
MADQPSEFRGSKYELKESQKEQYKLTGMLTANHKFGDFSLSGTVGIERFNEDQSYHNSVTTNGLRVPSLFELNNSVEAATTEAYAKINAKRINSVFGLISADWKGQVFLDVTGRNDWSSTLRYLDGSGNVSYFYPSFNGSWLLMQTFRDYLPTSISFAKLRASYAIVGGGTTPYLITSPGTYTYYNLFKDDYYNSGSYAYFDFENKNLGAADLKPEKQYAIEVGVDYRMFNNRLGLDVAYYKTNTKNQILELAAAPESGVSNRIINAGNIQNAGIEILITGTPVQTKDWLWDVSVNMTHNRNKIIELTSGVDKYKLDAGGDETEAWATVGGAYGDIYTEYAFKLDDDGNKLLNANGGWIRSGESTKIGSIQPKLLAGFTSNLTWKNISFGMVIDARFGGDIFSGSYNYGMANGVLKSTLNGRTQETGSLARTLDDGRVVYDGMIPDGVFDAGVKNKDGIDMSGMSY